MLHSNSRSCLTNNNPQIFNVLNFHRSGRQLSLSDDSFAGNRPFPSALSLIMKTRLSALSLVFIMRFKATRKWPILFVSISQHSSAVGLVPF